MSKPPTFVKGFIPSPDVIRNDLGPIAANVYGVVWMYNQMPGRECYAELGQISANSGFGTTATRTALRHLEERGWVQRVERKGKTTVYRDTGRWNLNIVGEEVKPSPLADTATATPTRGVALTREPQRETLPTPTPHVAPPTRGVALPQRVALPNIQEKQTTKHTRQQTEGEASRTSAPVRTRPAPKPETRRPTAPSPSSVIDPDDEMQAAFLEGCGLDPELTRSSVLISVADYAGRLRRRKFTAEEIREAAATWHEFLPHRDPEDLEPPHPQQLAEWVARRRASKAMASATSKARPVAQTFRVPFIER